MTLAIDVDRVTRVLLADGWHDVGETFYLDSYEFTEGTAPKFRGGQEDLVSATGFQFEEQGQGSSRGIISGPLTSVIAVSMSPKEMARQ